MTRKMWPAAAILGLIVLVILGVPLTWSESATANPAAKLSPNPVAGIQEGSPSASASEGRWVWQNPLPLGEGLSSAYFVDANTGWAVGNMGSIIKTTDGGVTWSLQLSQGEYYQLRSVFFVDAFDRLGCRHLWACPPHH